MLIISQNNDYQNIKMTFARFLKNINRDFDEIISRHFTREEVSVILNTKLSSVKGEGFYKIMVIVSTDLSRDCEKAFEQILKAKRKEFDSRPSRSIVSKTANKFQKFIDQFIILQSDIAYDAGIENTRLTKILKRQYIDFYAFEVYAIAKSQGILPKDAFEQLYKV